MENEEYKTETPGVDTAAEEKSKKKLPPAAIAAIVIAAVIVIAGVAAGVTAYAENKAIAAVKAADVTIEYDKSEHTVSPDDFRADGADEDKYTFEFDGDAQTTVTDIGEYNYTVKVSRNSSFFVKSKTFDVKYIIADTTAPVFAEDCPAELETYKDCPIETVSEKFTATDLTDVEITIDNESVDYTAAGEYKTNVYAADTSGNKATLEVTVKVKEPTLELNTAAVSVTVGDDYTVKADAKGKDSSVEWSSSDTSVATVDNGKITAAKAGTATITAKANGVEKECEVTVKAKMTQSSSTSKKQTSGSTSSSTSGSSSSSSSSSSSKKNNNSSSNSGGSASNTPQAYWCDEGGSHHVIDKGIGWYNSYLEAEEAANNYITQNNNGRAGRYEIQECDCGLYTAYVSFN